MTPEAERPYEKSVFINCPYDPGFVDLFHSIVFTVVAHGFVPRSAYTGFLLRYSKTPYTLSISSPRSG